MADYDRRLQRLEELAATSADDHDAMMLELCRKRTDELLASKEMLAYSVPDMPDEEWAVEWAAIRATIQPTVEARANGELLPAPNRAT